MALMAKAKQNPAVVRTVSSEVQLDLSELTRLVGFNLGAAYGLARRLFMTYMADLEIRPIEYSILALLAKAGGQQVQLSAALNVSVSNMAVVLDRLLKRGLLRREASESDRRAHSLRLTPTGKRLAAECAARLRLVEDDLLGELSPGERGIFAELLRKLVVPPCRKGDFPESAESIR